MTYGTPSKNWGSCLIRSTIDLDVKNLRVFIKDYDGVIPCQGELGEYIDENIEDRFSPHSDWVELPDAIKVLFNPTNIGQIVTLINT